MRRLEAAFVATLLAVVGVAGAVALWSTRVPDDLKLPRLSDREIFSAAELRDADRFEAFLRWNTVLATLVTLGVLALYAWRGHRLARESAAGRIGTGMLLGMLGLAIVWLVRLPFAVVELWWQRHHDISYVGYVEFLFGDWAALGGE